MPYDLIVVGAGLYGATFAREAADAGKKEHGRIRSKVINQVEQAGCQLTIEEGINYYELEEQRWQRNKVHTKEDISIIGI